MKYKLIISQKANIQIRQHLSFIFNVSKEAAKKQNLEFKKSINKIEVDPLSYPVFEGDYIPYGKYRKYIVSKRYIIVYQIKENIIYIDYVIDTRTDYSFLI